MISYFNLMLKKLIHSNIQLRWDHLIKNEKENNNTKITSI